MLSEALGDNPAPFIPSKVERSKSRLTSALFAFFTLGWADGVTGTLLPHFQADFHLSFMTSSLFFVASATGYGIGTLLVEHVMRFLGRYYITLNGAFATGSRRSLLQRSSSSGPGATKILAYSASQSRFVTLVLASLLHATFFAIMGSRRGFPSMFVAYVISAFARSFISGGYNNVYVSSTPRNALGYMYGTWAIGSFAAPLVCQSIIAVGVPWARFYCGSLVLSAINTSVIVFAFRPTPHESAAEVSLALQMIRPSQPGASLRSGAADISPSGFEPSEFSRGDLKSTSSVACTNYTKPPLSTGALLRACKEPYVWAFSLFSWLYTGTESSTQGFIVLYLLNTRNANPQTVGYVTSGFWGGMAISRLVWGYASPMITFRQRKYIIHGCILLAMCMHLCIWFVRSFVENAFSAAMVGVAYGPIFPGNLAQATETLPQELHLVSLAIISAFASFGAALFPFITGTLSNIEGAHILPYVTVAQTATMFCLWCFFPSRSSS
ncbi:MFS general substrate transporter [Obba rivulosa]|uniref:MFS general substrate transporter n=1 Tax=Obba rivulosa TaxID=1052685 RepID=A0A8E2J7G0_9APHY|nr:MFS general substrate transporter [Obba rivulosa]